MVSTATNPELRTDQSPIPQPERATVSVEEAGRILGIARNGAYDAVRRGDIPSIRIGRRIVVPRAALERMLQAQ